MSYTIDVYRGKIRPTNSLLDFATYVAFFPQLVAGPIERATSFLPQIHDKRVISPSKINEGVCLLIYGFFKKIVIADNMAQIANEVFGKSEQYTGFNLIIGLMAFAIQIYGDFSGYSDIARGLAKILGFDLMINFRLPYIAVSPSDFWQRWHISLSSWLRDYLYISLGGNRKGKWMTYRNLFITMLLGGLWHGAAWNFVFWGVFHGAILILYRLLPNGDDGLISSEHILVKYINVAIMFSLTLFGWLLFRATSIGQVYYFITHSFTQSAVDSDLMSGLVFYGTLLFVFESVIFYFNDLLIFAKLKWGLRSAFYCFMLVIIFMFGFRGDVEFIYFQF